MKALLRWTIFLLIGLPFQGLVYILYPFIWLYWRIVIYKQPEGDFIIAQHEKVDGSVGTDKDIYGLIVNADDHGAFSMYGALDSFGMQHLTDLDNNLLRKRNADGTLNRWAVSGDVLISYLFAYTAPSLKLTSNVKAQLQAIAWKYLKNLGVLSKDEINNEDVSNRCNNFGINYCPDSDFGRLGQPAGGPQFYTSSALFALASQDSIFFKFVFWAHWLLLGGWYWCWMPVVYTKDRPLHYVRDQSIKALYVHKYVFGNKWWIRIPMETIALRLSNIRNDLWFAMLGMRPVHRIPGPLDSFFSQKEDCTSRMSDRMNGYLGLAITELAEQAEQIRQRG